MILLEYLFMRPSACDPDVANEGTKLGHVFEVADAHDTYMVCMISMRRTFAKVVLCVQSAMMPLVRIVNPGRVL